MARATTETCCLILPLVLEKWQSDRLEKRFEIARQIYNTLLRFELNKLRCLEQSEEYSALQREIHSLYSEENQNKNALKKLYQKRKKLRKEAGFQEFTFKKDIKPFTSTSKIISAQKLPYMGLRRRSGRRFRSFFMEMGKPFISKGAETSDRCRVILRRGKVAVLKSCSGAHMWSGRD
ncbi:MAG: hypothetical protein IKS66_06000 [Oscillospiraceae bacterium]|nr:hypothetical protein [Oscillospiraceae bacterium]